MGIAAIVSLLVVACGFLLAKRALTEQQASASWIEALAWAPAVGFGLLSLIFFGWRLSGTPGAGRGSVLVLILLATLIYLRDGKRSDTEPPKASLPGDPVRLPRYFRWGAWAILILTVMGLLLAFHRWSTRWPLGTSDAINIWNVRARFLLFAQEELGELLHMMDRGHPDYPLLLPSSLAAQAGFWGTWDQALPQITGAMFVLGLGFMVYAGISLMGSGQLAALGTALLLASPPLWRWAFSQCADLPLSYLTLAAGVGLASQLASSGPGRVPPVLAGFALGLLPWTKNDGTVLAVALAVLFSFFWLLQPKTSRPGWPTVGAIAAGALPGSAAVAFFKLFWAPPGAADLFLRNSPMERLLDTERWTTVLTTVGEVVNPFEPSSQWRWVFAGLVTATVILGSVRSIARPDLAFLAGSLGLAVVGYLMVYVLSPYELAWHISKSVDRLFLHLLPLAFVWALAPERPSSPSLGVEERI